MHSLAQPIAPGAAPTHVRGTVLESPTLRRLIELDDDGWQRLGEVRVGDRLIVTDDGELLRAEVIELDGRRLVRTEYPLQHGRHVLVRRPFTEAVP